MQNVSPIQPRESARVVKGHHAAEHSEGFEKEQGEAAGAVA